MKRIIIIGANKQCRDFIQVISTLPNMKVVAIIDSPENAEEIERTNLLQIQIDDNLHNWLHKDIDYIINTTNKYKDLNQLLYDNKLTTVLIENDIVHFLQFVLKEQDIELSHLKLEADNLELILNNIGDGLIVVDKNEVIQFFNNAATDIVGVDKEKAIGSHIKKVIKNSKLPSTLQSQRREINKTLTLENNKQIVTSRIPIVNKRNYLIGAFAIFKDITDVLELAEKNTNLKEITIMLEAIIHSSNEAISVVDENAKGLMINPAYTKITGLNEMEIIGKPATVDITEGESVHLKVLKSRRSIRGEKIKVGPNRIEVIVNASPIIVDGKLKGSVAVIHDISEVQQLTEELERSIQIIRNLEASYTFSDIVGDSPEMIVLIEQAKLLAQTSANILIQGNNGTGKKLFANAIHNASRRRHNKFIQLNCSLYAEYELEKVLFGYNSGIYSGINSSGKAGLFESTKGGSVLLEQVDTIPLTLQQKLLKAIKENRIRRIGSSTDTQLDIRFITTTSENLELAISNNTFSQELFYHINRLPFKIPSLQERISDLPILIDHCLKKINLQLSRNVNGVSEDALEYLKQYDWPGNIKELENVLSRAVILMATTERTIERKQLPVLKGLEVNKPVKSENTPVQNAPLQEVMDEYERKYILQVYKKNNFNKTKTAKVLNVSVRNLYYKIEKYELDK